MTKRRFVLLGVLASLSVGGVTTGVSAETRGVIELFTSQGCNSCPAADRLLGELAKDPSLVALSMPVDYWDYLGWKDTLAMHGHTVRQRAYSRQRGDRDVYTPQVVINGVAAAIGSDKGAIDRALAKSRGNAAVLSVPLTVKVEHGNLVVSAPAGNEAVSAEVWACPSSKVVTVPIARGENGGRSISYHNVVRRWVKLGVWTGKAATWSVPLASINVDGADRVAVIVQKGGAAAPGAVLGATLAALR
ncbi:MAG: DUF1223 domain-containing protein [Proteobacteria bacterium]|nr:DUF1223 domain-containing protein [Pseudomonadota bacterium]